MTRVSYLVEAGAADGAEEREELGVDRGVCRDDLARARTVGLAGGVGDEAAGLKRCSRCK